MTAGTTAATSPLTPDAQQLVTPEASRQYSVCSALRFADGIDWNATVARLRRHAAVNPVLRAEVVGPPGAGALLVDGAGPEFVDFGEVGTLAEGRALVDGSVLEHHRGRPAYRFVRVGTPEGVVVAVIAHHSAADWVSFHVLLNAVAGREEPDPALTTDSADYAVWCERSVEARSSDRYQANLERVAADWSACAAQSTDVDLRSLAEVPDGELETRRHWAPVTGIGRADLHRLARAHRSSPFVVVLAATLRAWEEVLGRVEPVAFPVANRSGISVSAVGYCMTYRYAMVDRDPATSWSLDDAMARTRAVALGVLRTERVFHADVCERLPDATTSSIRPVSGRRLLFFDVGTDAGTHTDPSVTELDVSPGWSSASSVLSVWASIGLTLRLETTDPDVSSCPAAAVASRVAALLGSWCGHPDLPPLVLSAESVPGGLTDASR